METAQGKPPVETIRRIVAQRVADRDVRTVAREIGISPEVLRAFVAGSTPWGRTVNRLREWYQAQKSERPRTEIGSPPLGSLTMDVLRAAVHRAIEEHSLRAVASQVGLSPAGLRLVITREASPYSGTLRKLRDWYLREAGRRTPGDEATIRAAIDLLLGELPAGERGRTAQEMMDALRHGYQRAEIQPPAWFAKFPE
ncbi:MAG TPA: hypothetical protein VFJ82_22630 [Longimicrobium sp.]|nr:hypothetical protein [Longimicrobium sp.]